MFGLPTHLQHTDDTELKQIMQKAVMLQNCTVASLMAKSGVRGLMNYGVPLPDLRRIAAEAGTNHALARRLCQIPDYLRSLIGNLGVTEIDDVVAL